jgi:hypothetical protein
MKVDRTHVIGLGATSQSQRSKWDTSLFPPDKSHAQVGVLLQHSSHRLAIKGHSCLLRLKQSIQRPPRFFMILVQHEGNGLSLLFQFVGNTLGELVI